MAGPLKKILVASLSIEPFIMTRKSITAILNDTRQTEKTGCREFVKEIVRVEGQTRMKRSFTSVVVAYHVTTNHCSKWTWVVEEILTYGNRLRSTHCRRSII